MVASLSWIESTMAELAGLFIRLYLDEDVHPGVATAVRRRGFDALSTHELGRWGRSDPEQLAYAAAEGRALFTFNAVDFLRLHQAWLEAGRSHWGIIIAEQAPVGEITRRLLRFLNNVTADEMCDQIYWLPGFKG
jgi:predicted nuclease of predicted toxin-antitoxin system